MSSAAQGQPDTFQRVTPASTRPAGRTIARLLAALTAATLTAATLAACSGASCEGLPALQAEREQRRTAYLDFAATGPTARQGMQADDELHAFERRVYAMEQSCERR